jgi:hypothetical protein
MTTDPRERYQRPSEPRWIADRLDKIEQRLSRIEGGLILGGFAITIAAALLSRVI